MRKVLPIIMSAIIIAGCASYDRYVINPYNQNKVYKIVIDDHDKSKGLDKLWKDFRDKLVSSVDIGFNVSENRDKKVLINRVTDVSLRKQVNVGNIVCAINGEEIISGKQYLEILEKLTDKETVYIDFISNSRRYCVAEELGEKVRSPLNIVIEKLLLDNSKVNIYIATKVNVLAKFDNVVELRNSTSNTGITEMEEYLLRAFSLYDNFKIVDRSSISNAVEEQKLWQSGFVDEKSRGVIGRMTGATYILYIEYSFYADSVLNSQRLLEIETGNVVFNQLLTRYNDE